MKNKTPLEVCTELYKTVVADLLGLAGADNYSTSWFREVLSLGHDSSKITQWWRFTVSESSRREGLSRLLQLNYDEVEGRAEGGGKCNEPQRCEETQGW